MSCFLCFYDVICLRFGCLFLPNAREQHHFPLFTVLMPWICVFYHVSFLRLPFLCLCRSGVFVYPPSRIHLVAFLVHGPFFPLGFGYQQGFNAPRCFAFFSSPFFIYNSLVLILYFSRPYHVLVLCRRVQSHLQGGRRYVFTVEYFFGRENLLNGV